MGNIPGKRKREVDYIAAADTVPAEPITSWDFPWEDPNIDLYGKKKFNVHLSAKNHAKLKWICEHTPQCTLHSFTLQAVEDAIEEQVKRILKHLDDIKDVSIKRHK